ncbi:MAG TPA: UDP-2,3-diacylglucosamine diphosphatase [Burkholderiaceae bacterium]|nr:UDP-2,3-diacylglucosamine diphosphatase [Burkholderiaceae bacterium]
MDPTPPALAPTVDRLTLADPRFISDLHLSEAQPRTLARFERFAANEARTCAELLILGDLFEFWAGDDATDDAVARRVESALADLTFAGVRVYLMHGNRDLLLGNDFARRCGATLLVDPTLAQIAGGTVMLAHGDVYCTLDLDYMRFRAQVRNPDFQRVFLAKSLAERRAFVGQARAASEAGKQKKSMEIMDVTPEAIDDALRRAGVTLMIHGHTHRPATHRTVLDGNAAERWVLPDWDFDADPVRGGYLRISGGAWRRVDLSA